MNIRTFTITSLSIGLLLSTHCAQADALDHWVWRNPSPFASWLRSVCFGGDRFVAVGDGGMVHTSADGLSWDAGMRIGTNYLNAVAHLGGQFIAVGDNGTILTSPDALGWISRSSGTTNHLLAVTYGNGRFVVCGTASQLTVSTDGISWTALTLATITPNNLSSISFGNGVFVVPETFQEYSWTSVINVLVSTDAQSWTRRYIASSSYYPDAIHGVAFGNGTFVFSAAVEIPSDLGPPGWYRPIRRLYSSVDGTNWLAGVDSPGTPYGKRSFTFAGGLFLVQGRIPGRWSQRQRWVSSRDDVEPEGGCRCAAVD
jgi:hypothetical protein